MLDVKAVGKDWSDELIFFLRDMVLKNLDYLLQARKFLLRGEGRKEHG